MEENGLAACWGCESAFDFGESVVLFGVELFFGVVEEGFLSIRIALDGDVFEGDKAFFSKGFDGASCTFAELRDGHAFGANSLQKGEDGVLSFGSFGELLEGFGIDVLAGDGLFDGFLGMVLLTDSFGEQGAHDVL